MRGTVKMSNDEAYEFVSTLTDDISQVVNNFVRENGGKVPIEIVCSALIVAMTRGINTVEDDEEKREIIATQIAFLRNLTETETQ